MGSGINRRDWLKLIGGSAVGLMLSPIPWKVLDESAKWTQNWNWTPVPPKGRVNYRLTTCTLCPQACGVRVRCVENQPVGLSGIPGHPLNNGKLCAIGLGGHLMSYHPSRIAGPVTIDAKTRVPAPIPLEDAISRISGHVLAASGVAVLDMQPGRSISYIYKEFLAGLKHGTYTFPNQTDGINAGPVNRTTTSRFKSYGIDIDRTRTIISFRTPLLDGWGTLAQSAEIGRRNKKGSKAPTKVYQVESVSSRSAGLADEWIPVRPGTEAIFALGLAHVILEENLFDRTIKGGSENLWGERSLSELAGKYPLSRVSTITGVPDDKIAVLARELANNRPTAVIFGGDPVGGPFGDAEEIIFADLNILLGAIGPNGTIVPRPDLPSPGDHRQPRVDGIQLSEVPDHSIEVLLIDGADSGTTIPWQLVSRKLVPVNPRIVSLSYLPAGVACHADYVIPSPAYMEMYSDMPTPAGFSRASYNVSVPLMEPPASAIEPLEFLKRLAISTGSPNKASICSITMRELIRNRIAKIFELHEGEVFDADAGETKSIGSMASSRELVRILERGGCWTGNARSRVAGLTYKFLGNSDYQHVFSAMEKLADISGSASDIRLLPHGTRGAGSSGVNHPMMSKIYQESNLRLPSDVASISPSTGKMNGLSDGKPVRVKTDFGQTILKARFDQSIMDGVVQVQVGEETGTTARRESLQGSNTLDICRIESDSTWKTTSVQLSPL